MLATVFSRAQFGMQAPPVTIDVHVTSGLPSLCVVGLPEAAVKESKDRVRSPIMTCGFRWPPGCVTINLSPADLPKDGGRSELLLQHGSQDCDGRYGSYSVRKRKLALDGLE